MFLFVCLFVFIIGTLVIPSSFPVATFLFSHQFIKTALLYLEQLLAQNLPIFLFLTLLAVL